MIKEVEEKLEEINNNLKEGNTTKLLILGYEGFKKLSTEIIHNEILVKFVCNDCKPLEASDINPGYLKAGFELSEFYFKNNKVRIQVDEEILGDTFIIKEWK